MSNPWKCCIKEPSETGKKVLCHRRGDIYVAVRMKNYYVPMPFADHYFSPDLAQPEHWQEIDFPEGLTGYMRIMPEGIHGELITWSEYEIDYPDKFNELVLRIIKSLGKLKRPAHIPPMPNDRTQI